MTPPRIPRWYTLAWLLALPAVAVYLLWRGLRQPEYRRHWAERFLGRGPRAAESAAETAAVAAYPAAPIIWIHAVSVGETRAVRPLLEQLARAHADARFVLTHMTPTGRAAGAQLALAFPGRVRQRYLPYDLPFATRRFLDETRPRVGVLMETEVWPQLLAQTRARGVPVVLANARLSQRSLDKALRQRELMRAAAAGITMVGAQTPDDAARIGRLYEGPIRITGNVKFDLAPERELIEQGRRWRARWARWPAGVGDRTRPLWLFASTREGEEQLLFDALREAALLAPRSSPPPAALPTLPLLLFVPRHPQRFGEVARRLEDAGATVLRRASWDGVGQRAGDGDARARAAVGDTLVAAAAAAAATAAATAAVGASSATAGADTTVLLGDSMGEMALYYAMADVAFIGGSLLPLGGQNLIEACGCGCPVVFGPHMFNFAQAAADALAAGAARACADAADVVAQMQAISGSTELRERMAKAATDFARMHGGAAARTVALIEGAMEAALGPSAAAAR
jgi:3-deoxy-D-manno-octulosonic-acid transferase